MMGILALLDTMKNYFAIAAMDGLISNDNAIKSTFYATLVAEQLNLC